MANNRFWAVSQSVVRAGKAMLRILFRPITKVVAVIVLAGCINTPLPDYYVLTAERGSAGVSVALADLALGLGPITIPETINRPNIVTPLDSNQLEVAEYHRWSEPLIDNISRVVITNVADRLGVNKIYAYPWLGNKIDYQVKVDVLQMIGTPAGSVYLQVRWQLLTGEKPRQLLETRISEYRQAVNGEGYSAMVSAYSRAIAALSDEISTALNRLSLVTSALDKRKLHQG